MQAKAFILRLVLLECSSLEFWDYPAVRKPKLAMWRSHAEQNQGIQPTARTEAQDMWPKLGQATDI